MKRATLLQVVVLAAVWGAAGQLHASLLRAMDLGELVASADTIVVGKVVSHQAAWDLRHRKIVSTIEIDVEEIWKGPAVADRRMTIVQPGGSVGDIEMTVLGMPTFTVGEKSLLFLRGQRQFQVAGMSLGKRTLAWNETGKQWLVEAPNTDCVVELGPGARLRQAQRPSPIPLSDLREQVRRAIENPP